MSQAWKVFVGLGAVIGLAAGLLGVARNWDLVTDFSGWLYPLGVISLLVAAVIGLAITLTALVLRGGYKSDDERRHDRQVVREVRKRAPRDAVEWLRDHNFGESWHVDDMTPFWQLYDALAAVELKPFDKELRLRLDGLRRANESFMEFYAEHTSADVAAGREDWRYIGRSVGWDPQLLREALNEHAGAVVPAYDDFVDRARLLHLLEAPVPT